MPIELFQPKSRFILRLGLTIVFSYFGTLAVMRPEVQAATWLARPIYDLISSILPISIFMVLFGLLQLAVAIGIFFKAFVRYLYLLAMVMLLGVVINLTISAGFFNDIVMRDLALACLAFGLLLDDLGK